MKKYIAAVALLTTLLVTNIHADTAPTNYSQGIFILAQGGQATIADSDLNGMIFRAGVGYDIGLTPDLHFTAEADYSMYPDFDDESLQALSIAGPFEYMINTWDFLIGTRYYFANNFSIIGKVGASVVDEDLNINGLDIRQSSTLPEINVGIGYDFTPHFGVNATYNTLLGGNDRLNDPAPNVNNLSAIMLGLTYTFSI